MPSIWYPTLIVCSYIGVIAHRTNTGCWIPCRWWLSPGWDKLLQATKMILPPVPMSRASANWSWYSSPSQKSWIFVVLSTNCSRPGCINDIFYVVFISVGGLPTRIAVVSFPGSGTSHTAVNIPSAACGVGTLLSEIQVIYRNPLLSGLSALYFRIYFKYTIVERSKE